MTEERRYRLHRKLEETLGDEEAATLMEHLPPYPWDKLAMKEDVKRAAEDLRREVTIEIRRLDEKIDTRFDSLEATSRALYGSLEANTETRYASLEANTETRYASLDQKTETRFAALEASTESRFASLEEKTESRFDSLEAKTETRFASLEEKTATRFDTLVTAKEFHNTIRLHAFGLVSTSVALFGIAMTLR